MGFFPTLSAQKVVYLDKTTFKLKNWDNTLDVVLNRGVSELEYRYTPQDEIGSLLGRTKAFYTKCVSLIFTTVEERRARRSLNFRNCNTPSVFFRK